MIIFLYILFSIKYIYYYNYLIYIYKYILIAHDQTRLYIRYKFLICKNFCTTLRYFVPRRVLASHVVFRHFDNIYTYTILTSFSYSVVVVVAHYVCTLEWFVYGSVNNVPNLKYWNFFLFVLIIFIHLLKICDYYMCVTNIVKMKNCFNILCFISIY